MCHAHLSSRRGPLSLPEKSPVARPAARGAAEWPSATPLALTAESARQPVAIAAVATKRAFEMAKGGKAWRGYFEVGEELTSGVVDEKEGLYFGEELPASDPRPLH